MPPVFTITRGKLSHVVRDSPCISFQLDTIGQDAVLVLSLAAPATAEVIDAGARGVACLGSVLLDADPEEAVSRFAQGVTP